MPDLHLRVLRQVARARRRQLWTAEHAAAPRASPASVRTVAVIMYAR